MLAGAGHTDQRDHFGVGQRPVHQHLQQHRVLAVQVRGDGDDHIPTAEHLPAGQVAVRSQYFGQDLPGLSESETPDRATALGDGVDRRGQAVGRPAHVEQLPLPPLHQVRLARPFLERTRGAGRDPPGLVGRLAAPGALGVDLRRPLGVHRHHLGGHPGETPMSELPRRPRIGLDPITQLHGYPGGGHPAGHGGSVKMLPP